jgi:predicted nucleotidyltransferase
MIYGSKTLPQYVSRRPCRHDITPDEQQSVPAVADDVGRRSAVVSLCPWHDRLMSSDSTAQQLDRLVALLREVFGDDVIGAYLHGSAVMGGLRPHSDIDVLGVLARPATTEEKRRLIDGLLAISSGWPPRSPLRPIELTLVVHSEIRPWRYPPTIELQFGEWFRKDIEQGRDEPWDRVYPDLAPLLAMVLQGNRPLFGPPPAQLIDPIPQEDLVHAIAGDLDALLPGLFEEDTRFAILTMARIWMTVTTGAFTTKDAAADWALPRLPAEHREVLERARAIYVGEHTDHWDDLRPKLQPYADHLFKEIRTSLEFARTLRNDEDV